MNITENVPLKEYSTMRLGGSAAYFGEVKSKEDLKEALAFSKERSIPLMLIGGGSNIVWRDEGYKGLLLVNRIPGFEVISEDVESAYITVGGGENWDGVVAKSVELGLTGIECLSLIPGTAGATPIQNVGAYGQEIAQTLVSLTALDIVSGELLTIPGADCGFAYRTSRFKSADKGRYLIADITLRLNKGSVASPLYAALQAYLDEHNISDLTPKNVRDAVIEIRSSKLPDPKDTANCGSFFANPVIDPLRFFEIEQAYSMVPHWPAAADMVKISAAWLIEQAGFKDYFDSETGMATWPSQPLVLINHSAKSTADLFKFADKIKTKVYEQFGIELQMEPELLP